MATTHADVTEGERLDITVEFVTRRAVQLEEGRVHQLIVADRAGTRFPVLVAPGSDAFLDLKTGGAHHISRMLGAVSPDSTGTHVEDCPDCGGSLRSGRAVDAAGPAVARAAARLGIEGPFGVVDERASVRRLRNGTGGDAVDDWTPMGEAESADPPDYVCRSCGRHVDGGELHSSRATEPVDNGDAAEMAAPASPAATAARETVGIAAGGAKDAGNFRENVARGYTPQPEAITDEGLFYDYHFETGERDTPDALFAPRYAAATSDHPLDGTTERYLSVGLDSTLSLEAFERPRLDLVVVLDVSGSMDSPFDDYYYDEGDREREAGDDGTTKLEAATESLCALTEQLRPDDRLGVVLFNYRAHVAKPLRDVATTDMPAIRDHVREIAAGGGTNLADGFEAAADMLTDGDADPRVERRVVFMTDMMPNTGATGESELAGLFADAAAAGVHTTFVGMGLDANAALAETLSGIRGANHYFVHSAEEFERRLGDEFDYMVTPLAYDLTLELDAEGYELEAVHGAPAPDAGPDRLLHVGTLFPSATDEGEARGGVVLARLRRTDPDAELALVASWTERDGSHHAERVSVAVPDEPESFAHGGVRKAVALARYARELRDWAREVHERSDAGGVDDWLLPDRRGAHERESVPLVVPPRYVARFQRLRDYLEGELYAVGDESLQREVNLLATLCEEAPTAGRPEVTDR